MGAGGPVIDDVSPVESVICGIARVVSASLSFAD